MVYGCSINPSASVIVVRTVNAHNLLISSESDISWSVGNYKACELLLDFVVQFFIFNVMTRSSRQCLGFISLLIYSLEIL